VDARTGVRVHGFSMRTVDSRIPMPLLQPMPVRTIDDPCQVTTWHAKAVNFNRVQLQPALVRTIIDSFAIKVCRPLQSRAFCNNRTH
jgi:hypothetical protein